MHPITHLLLGWTVASIARLTHRERAAVTLAGVVPDLDGLGILAEVLTRSWDRPLLWWSDYHHVLAHNLCGGLLVAALSGILANSRHPAPTWPGPGRALP